MIPFADDERMREREALYSEFCENILAPEEESAFISDEATLFDVSLIPEDELIERIRVYYGCKLTRVDLQKHFWLLLDELDACRTKERAGLRFARVTTSSNKCEVSRTTADFLRNDS